MRTWEPRLNAERKTPNETLNAERRTPNETANREPRTANVVVVPVPAASVIPVRQRDGRLEVFLTRRKPTLRFLGGYSVFPGGRVDPEDHDATTRLSHINPRCAERFMSIPARLALAHWVAAFRELHEETGLWLGDGPEPRPDTWHADLETNALLPARRLCYVDHWITPPWVPMRFDTRFFVTVLDGDPAFHLSAEEIDDAAWIAPGAALAAAEANRLQLIKPTIVLLQTLAAFGSVNRMRQVWRGLGRRTDPALATSREAQPVPQG